MGQMTPSGGNWTGSNTQSTQLKNYTFYTDETFVDKNIVFTVKAKDGVLSSTEGKVEILNGELSNNNTSGIKIIGSGKGTVTTSGWIDAGSATAAQQIKYLTQVNLTNGKNFIINDGINDWNWSIDSNGNVSIT